MIVIERILEIQKYHAGIEISNDLRISDGR